MDIIFLALFVGVVVMYMLDRKGWNATFKRVSTIIRANIESGTPIKTLEPSKEHDDWTKKFKEIENPASAAKPKPRHEVVSRDYEYAVGKLWPRATCKCGFRASTPPGIWSESQTFSKTKVKMDDHVRLMNKADELKASGEKFQW